LLGISELNVHQGHNLLAISEGFAAMRSYVMEKGSFITDDILFEMSRDGVFENSRAINRHTREPIPLTSVYTDYIKSSTIVNTAEYILKNDIMSGKK
jgi:hypothetical protein